MNYSKFGIAGIALLGMFSCKQKPAMNTAAAEAKVYPTVVLAKQDVEMQTVFPAVLKGEEDIDIKPRIEGFIEEVYIDEGAIVTKGQALFKISSPATVQALANAQATCNTAQTDLERMRPLADKGIISTVRLKTYENTLASARATLQQAQANAGYTTVTSPVSGTVGSVPYRLGSLVTSTSVLTTVSNTKNIVAQFSMNEKDLLSFMRIWKGNTQEQKIKNMPPVSLQLADGSMFEVKGRIETISGVVDAVSGAVSIRAIFANPQALLRSGTSGKVIIPQMLKDVLVIPQKSSMQQQDKVLVYRVAGDSVVQQIIQVRATPDGKSYAVLGGINAGDRIVTDGLATLKNGQKIKL